jgi:hypothetical protein
VLVLTMTGVLVRMTRVLGTVFINEIEWWLGHSNYYEEGYIVVRHVEGINR